MTQKSITHVFKFLTPPTPPVEKNCESSWVQARLYTKIYKCVIWSVWIITAWQYISPEVTVKDFKKRFISSAVDGNVRSECEEGEEDEGSDCEDGDSDTDW